MADVLIVCVREDEPQAKALAEMFEAAGFSIGGAPSSDAGLRSSGAGLVVWSQASIRSRPFLDAAQRVINAEKAVVASLIEPPPPSSIGDSPVFDLSRWDGDPNDPALDPLFFAVDRMVNSARAAVGAAPAPEPDPYVAPQRPVRTPAPAPTYTRAPPPPPASDPLGTEAEHWRAIRDSRDPSDFMDYLSRYGPQGAFAEVAEPPLKQMTARGEARPAPAPAPLPPPPPRPRAESLPPRRVEIPPTRRPEPPPRRPEPQRRFERSYDRPDLREPAPREGGGAMRAFILIALLGGAALAGGLYFGGGMPDFSNQQQAQDIDVAPPPALYDENEPASAEDIAGVSLAEASDPAPRRPEPPPRRETAQQPAAAPARAEEREPDTPSPTASWAGNGQGGPVSLQPNERQVASNNTTPSTAVPLTPPQTTPSNTPTSSPTTSAPANVTRPPPTPQRAAGTVTWAQRPSARRISDLYPSRALREGVGGRVELSCRVLVNQALSCNVASESPAGLGFARAALSAASSYRANATLSNGASSTGASTSIVVQFQAPPQ